MFVKAQRFTSVAQQHPELIIQLITQLTFATSVKAADRFLVSASHPYIHVLGTHWGISAL